MPRTPIPPRPPSAGSTSHTVNLDDVFRRYAQNTQTWHRDTPARMFTETVRELTGAADTFSAPDNNSSRDMLSDIYSGPETVRNWGPEALPDMIRLADAKVLGWQMPPLLEGQTLSKAQVGKIIDAAVQTDDVKQAGQVFTQLLNNPSLVPAHQRALLDWLLRRNETRDVIDPVTGKIVKPKVAAPPSAENIVARLAAQVDPGMRAFAPVFAGKAGLSTAARTHAVMVAIADPNPQVRNAAAPMLYRLAPPSRQRVLDLVDAYFSKTAKAKVRTEIEAQIGKLPEVADVDGDVLPQGDFYPARMEGAAEMQAEFLGTMLHSFPVGADLEWLIGIAQPHAKGNYGLTSDVMVAMKRNGATPKQRADVLATLGSWENSELDAFRKRASLDLVAQDPSVANTLSAYLDPEIVNAAVNARHDVLRKSDEGLSALLRAGKVSVADVMPRIQSQEVSSELLKAALTRGAAPADLLDGLIAHLGPYSPRQMFIAATELLRAARLPPAKLDQAMVKLIGSPALLGYGVNDNDTRGVPSAPMPEDPLDPEFAVPPGTVSQALLSIWLASKPSQARVEAVVTAATAATDPGVKSWLMHEFSHAGARSPTLEQERETVWGKLPTDREVLAAHVGDYIVPATGSAHVGDVEAAVLAAARKQFGAFKAEAGPTFDVAGALATAGAAPVADRLTVLWKSLTGSASSLVQGMTPSSVVALAYQLPEPQGRMLLNAVSRFETDRVAALPASNRAQQAWGGTTKALFAPAPSPSLLSAAAVIDFATRAPELKPTIMYWLSQPAADGVRAQVLAAMPDLATPSSSALRKDYAPPLPNVGDTAPLLKELTARLAQLNDVNARLAANPGNTALEFEQMGVEKSFSPEVFKLAETRQIGTLTQTDLAPFAKEAGLWFEFTVALHQGEGYEALAAKFRSLEPLDWTGADAVLKSQGPEAALGHLLLSGEMETTPAATFFTQSVVLSAAGRCKAPETIRKNLLLDGLFEDPLPALKGVLLWNGPSLDWALPALNELATGSDIQVDDYIRELQSLLPTLVSDPRLSNEAAVQLALTAVNSFIAGNAWRTTSGDELLAAGPLLGAALKRGGLTPEQRKALVGAAMYSGHWRDASAGLTGPEKQMLTDHVLGRTWQRKDVSVGAELSSMLTATDLTAAGG